MNFMEKMMANDLDNLDNVINDMYPEYECMKDFRTIKQGDIVNVRERTTTLGTTVYITKGRETNITNLFILEQHFKLIE